MPAVSSQQALSVASMIDLTDKDLDTLKHIRLDFNSNMLTAYATDRYVLAKARYELDEPYPEMTAYLDKQAVKFIRDNAKTTSVFIITNTLVQTDNGHTYPLLNDGSRLPKIDLDQVIVKAQLIESKEQQSVNMNLKLIERVNKLLTPAQANLTPAKRNSDWTMTVGGIKDPIVFTEATDTFIALAQPKLRRA
jgi:hypothetical protein